MLFFKNFASVKNAKKTPLRTSFYNSFLFCPILLRDFLALVDFRPLFGLAQFVAAVAGCEAALVGQEQAVFVDDLGRFVKQTQHALLIIEGARFGRQQAEYDLGVRLVFEHFQRFEGTCAVVVPLQEETVVFQLLQEQVRDLHVRAAAHVARIVVAAAVVRPHFQTQFMPEVDHRVIDVDKLGRELLYLLLVDIFARVRGIRVIVREQLPQAVVELKNFPARVCEVLHEFFVRFDESGFQLFGVFVNGIRAADIVRPRKFAEDMGRGRYAQLRLAIARAVFELLERFDEVVVFAAQLARDAKPDVFARLVFGSAVDVAEEVTVIRDVTLDPVEAPNEVEVPHGLGVFAVGDDREVVLDLVLHDGVDRMGFALLVAFEFLVERVLDIVAVFDLRFVFKKIVRAQQAAYDLEFIGHGGVPPWVCAY